MEAKMAEDVQYFLSMLKMAEDVQYFLSMLNELLFQANLILWLKL